MTETLETKPSSDAPWMSGAGNPFSSQCPSRLVLDHITSKWGVLVIVALSQGSMRWGELHRHIDGISEKMLAQTLRLLEADGFLDRTSQGTVPPRVDYALTPTGQEVAGLLVPLVHWVGEHVGMPLPPRTGSADG